MGANLPLSFAASQELKNECDPRLRLVGYFGLSRLLAQYHELHPAFDRFCSGLMADERAQTYLRENSELRKMFPPRKLRGVVPGEGLIEGVTRTGFWYTLETLKAWCDLRARVCASITHRLDDPDRQTAESAYLFQKVLAPELQKMFSRSQDF
jgi:hypothetical protein